MDMLGIQLNKQLWNLANQVGDRGLVVKYSLFPAAWDSRSEENV